MIYILKKHFVLYYLCFRNIKPLADIQLTLNLLNIEENPNFKFRYPKGII